MADQLTLKQISCAENTLTLTLTGDYVEIMRRFRDLSALIFTHEPVHVMSDALWQDWMKDYYAAAGYEPMPEPEPEVEVQADAVVALDYQSLLKKLPEPG